MLKVVFVDIDGVLNTNNSIGRYKIEGPQLRRLRHLIRGTGAKIVISSAWRSGRVEMNILKDKFAEEEILTEVIGETPYLHQNEVDPVKIRAAEIKQWLENNPVDRFVILDDLPLGEYFKGGEFFLVPSQDGLTATIANSVVNYLNRP